ncbi:MAG: T9SS type A sorting domain-containing protein [Chitinophagales bacterium]
MKKFYFSLLALLATAGFASAQCTIDPQAQTTPGASPAADQLPCLVQNVAYDQTIQGKVQTDGTVSIAGFSVLVTVDSVRMDSISGLPIGINWSKNPDVLPGGGNGCVRFFGTTSDPVGRYNLTARGTVWFHVTSPIDTHYVYNGNLNQFSPFGGYYLDVIAQAGDPCHTTAINEFNSDLNSAITVRPNPNNGVFEFILNSGSRVDGAVIIRDITGREVYNQRIDVLGLYNTTINLANMPRGIYTLQVRTANGFATRNISVQ